MLFGLEPDQPSWNMDTAWQPRAELQQAITGLQQRWGRSVLQLAHTLTATKVCRSSNIDPHVTQLNGQITSDRASLIGLSAPQIFNKCSSSKDQTIPHHNLGSFAETFLTVDTTSFEC